MPPKWSHFFSLGFSSITALTERASPFQEAPDVLKYSLGCPFTGEMKQADCLTGSPVPGGTGGGQAACLFCPGVSWGKQWTYGNYFAWKNRGRFLAFGCSMAKVIIPQLLFQRCSKTSAADPLFCFIWVVCRLQILTGDVVRWQTISECPGIHRQENGVSKSKNATCSSLLPTQQLEQEGRLLGCCSIYIPFWKCRASLISAYCP